MKHNGPGVRMWQANMHKGGKGHKGKGNKGNTLATNSTGAPKENINNAKDVVVCTPDLFSVFRVSQLNVDLVCH